MSKITVAQQALVEAGAIYEILISDNENQSSDEILSYLGDNSPEDIANGSVAYYNTIDEDFYPVEYMFSYNDGWAMERVLRGNVGGGGEVGIRTVNGTFISTRGDYKVILVSLLDGYMGRHEYTISSGNPTTIPILCGENGAVMLADDIYDIADDSMPTFSGGIELNLDSFPPSLLITDDFSCTAIGTQIM